MIREYKETTPPPKKKRLTAETVDGLKMLLDVLTFDAVVGAKYVVL